MGKLNLDSLLKTFHENLLSYVYMLEIEFREVNAFINELKNYRPFILDVRESTKTQNALNIAVIISYARNFKTSYGFNNIKDVADVLIQDFTKQELKFHKKIVTLRDKEFAHSDASSNDIQIYTDNFFSYSRKVVRELLEKEELEMLSKMVGKIRKQIDVQIKILK